MGLDMYVWSVNPDDLSDQDVVRQVDVILQKQHVSEIWYWRKHHDLHGWMHNLYREKGGTAELFNCVTVRLTIKDLDRLEKDVIENKLPETTGFFFGNNPPDEESINEDKQFIAAAREAIKNGRVVFYDSWW